MDENKDINVNDNLQAEPRISDTDEKTEESPELAQEPAAELDYAEVVRGDIRTLSEKFPELKSLSDILELENPIRYAALRDLGLSPEEAYLATSRARRSYDNRAHLYSSPMVSSSKTGFIPEDEMEVARGLFADMSDSQIRQLYKKVTK